MGWAYRRSQNKTTLDTAKQDRGRKGEYEQGTDKELPYPGTASSLHSSFIVHSGWGSKIPLSRLPELIIRILHSRAGSIPRQEGDVEVFRQLIRRHPRYELLGKGKRQARPQTKRLRVCASAETWHARPRRAQTQENTALVILMSAGAAEEWAKRENEKKGEKEKATEERRRGQLDLPSECRL